MTDQDMIARRRRRRLEVYIELVVGFAGVLLAAWSFYSANYIAFMVLLVAGAMAVSHALLQLGTGEL